MSRTLFAAKSLSDGKSLFFLAGGGRGAKFSFKYISVVLSASFIFDRFSRQDQFAVYIFRFNQVTDTGLHEIRHHSSVCRCDIADFYYICQTGMG